MCVVYVIKEIKMIVDKCVKFVVEGKIGDDLWDEVYYDLVYCWVFVISSSYNLEDYGIRVGICWF